MSDQPKYQVSLVFTRQINGLSINENHTLRGDDKMEVYKDRLEIIEKIAPSAKTFPEDEGNVAHEATQAIDVIPVCNIHTTKPMTSVKGRYGYFWSCKTKLADDTWCKGKPIFNKTNL